MKRGALILCGGRSTRMGRDKAWLPIGEEVLLQRAVRLLTPLVDEVTVVSRRHQALPTLPGEPRIVHDEVEGQGPLGGLGPGLTACDADAVFATGCDVPFLERAVVELLFERLGDHDVAVAEAEGHLHPLTAVYRPSVLPVLRDLFLQGRRRPRDVFDAVDTVRVGEDALRKADPDLVTLANVNTPEVYRATLERLGRGGAAAVRVEFYEGARKLAGATEVVVTAVDLGGALGAVLRRHPALEPRVIDGGRLAEHWRASLDGREWIEDPATPLGSGDVIVLVSALAGG